VTAARRQPALRRYRHRSPYLGLTVVQRRRRDKADQRQKTKIGQKADKKKRELQGSSRVSSVDAEGPRYGGMDRFSHAKQR